MAGCVAFNLDLEHYGVELPVMPENWKHYIGIDLNQANTFFERLTGQMDSLERIGRAGHDWALDHYSPRRMAERFLAELGFTTPVFPAANIGTLDVEI